MEANHLADYYERMLRDILETSDDPDSRKRARLAIENGQSIKVRLSHGDASDTVKTSNQNK